MTPRSFSTAVTATLALALVGCGGGPSAPTSGVGGGSPARRASATVPKQITVGSAQKILTLDPDLAADGYSEGVVHLLGGNLFELGPTGKVAPLLAERGSASKDGLTWTFTL